jgi:hypothetical protein
MATYSKYTGTNYPSVASRIYLTNPATQSYEFSENLVYSSLPDNEEKEIQPIHIRNSILSIYDSNPFKNTSIGGIQYTGIDANDQDLKMPIFIGKRMYRDSESIGGSIISQKDITIYNTKSDSSSRQSKTSMAFLAGTSSFLSSDVPSIDADLTKSSLGERIDLTFRSRTGNVNILSKGPNQGDGGGTVSINGIVYPEYQVSGASASEDKTLYYRDGIMSWETLEYNDPGYYGATSTNVTIYGSGTYVNGYSLDFTDFRYSTADVGSISLGDSFESDSIRDVLERIIYDYIPPICGISLLDPSQRYLEIGTYPDIYLKYSISSKSRPTLPTALGNMIPNQVAPISDMNTKSEGIAKGIVIVPLEKEDTTFTITTSDGSSFNSSSVKISGVYPIFYGYTSSTTFNNNLLKSLIKIVDGEESQSLDVYRDGLNNNDRLYFIYDYEYGDLSQILDVKSISPTNDGDILYSRFLEYDAYFSSPDGLWAGKRFRIYISEPNFNTVYLTPDTVSMTFRFNF